MVQVLILDEITKSAILDGCLISYEKALNMVNHPPEFCDNKLLGRIRGVSVYNIFYL